MSDIAYVNNSDHAEEGYVINPLISFRSWEEYLRLKDMRKQDLYALMRERRKEQRETDLMRITVEKAINSNEFDNIVEKEL